MLASFWVPLTSIIALVIPTIGLWPATGLSQITLEVCALITAFAYFKAYQRLEKRAYFGDKESTWSLDKSKQLSVEGTASIAK